MPDEPQKPKEEKPQEKEALKVIKPDRPQAFVMISEYPMDVLFALDEKIYEGAKSPACIIFLKNKFKQMGANYKIPSASLMKQYISYKKLDEFKGMSKENLQMVHQLKANERVSEAIKKHIDLRTVDPTQTLDAMLALWQTYAERIEIIRAIQTNLQDARYEQTLNKSMDSAKQCLETISKMKGQLNDTQLMAKVFGNFLKQITPLIYQSYTETNGMEKFEMFKDKAKDKFSKMNMAKIIEDTLIAEALKSPTKP